MADLDTNTTLMIAAIGAFSAIAGGLISSGANYLIEKQRSEKEAIKVQREDETRELELRNQAYIRFLSINEDQVYRDNMDGETVFDPGLVEESIAIIITHGSSAITSLVSSAYPFNTWNELNSVKKIVMKELVAEKDGVSASKTTAGGIIKKNSQ
jgi:hypothetical protein